MKKWCENKNVIVYFSDIPYVSIRYCVPSMTDAEIKAVKKYPFINKRTITVRLVDKIKNRTYEFDIPKNYCYDGASVPRFFWRIIGAPTDNSFLIGALVHDVMCENHQYVMNDRHFSSEVFNALLESSKVGKLKRYLMFHSVDCYQRFCKWES